MILQGLIVLLVGLSMVFAFLLLLILVMSVAGKIIPRFNYVLPDEQPKSKRSQGAPAVTAQAREAEEIIAVAIAAAVAQGK
jgi:sodium pump decarboxylase gamma subunit